jgi:hypothetical protein
MTAAATRTGTSGRAKHALSASSKAAPEQDAAEETAASQPEGADEQREGVDEPTETVAVQPESVDGPTEVIAAQSESIAEQIEPSAAPVESVAALGESIPELAEASAATPKAGAPEAKTVAASPETGPASPDTRDEKPRFRIFVIDSGWNHPASKVLNENIELIHALTHEDPIYVLDRDQSVALLRKNKRLIGHDPIIAVHDLTASGFRKHLGFRLHLGLLDGEADALSALKMFARFINTHRESQNLEADVRRKLHKQGMSGAIEIVGGAAHHVLMEA